MENFWHKNSKYSKIYMALMASASAKNRSKKIEYFENHHIFPKSLGGTRTKINMVLLTAREHIIAHRLLIRMFNHGSLEWTSMVFAFKRIIDAGSKHNGERQKFINSRHLAERRRLHGLAMSIRMRGRTMPDHVRKAISEHNSGRKLSQEHKDAISASLKKTLSTPDQKAKISAERKSRVHSQQRRERVAESMKRVWAERRALKS